MANSFSVILDLSILTYVTLLYALTIFHTHRPLITHEASPQWRRSLSSPSLISGIVTSCKFSPLSFFFTDHAQNWIWNTNDEISSYQPVLSFPSFTSLDKQYIVIQELMTTRMKYITSFPYPFIAIFKMKNVSTVTSCFCDTIGIGEVSIYLHYRHIQYEFRLSWNYWVIE